MLVRTDRRVPAFDRHGLVTGRPRRGFGTGAKKEHQTEFAIAARNDWPGRNVLELAPGLRYRRPERFGDLELTSLSSALHASEAPTGRVIRRHSLLVRVCHWINAGCFVVLLMSGMQIFNADPALTWGPATNFDHPFFSLSARENDDGDPTAGVTTIFGRPFDTTGFLGASRGDDGQLEERGFPSWATLPAYQDLAMGRRWHFFFGWILVLNGLVYFAYLLGRRHIRDLWPSAADIRAIPRAIVDHARLRFPEGDEALHYNVLQKLAYLSVVIAFPLLILAGLTMSPAMDSAFPWLLTLFGGRQAARAAHFLLAAYLVLFVIVHLVMVVLSGPINNMRSMITGRYRIKEARR
jgi:thiosulfate reductase cytochrome b subunit